MKVKSESEVTQSVLLLATPWTAAYQAPPSMGFSRQKYWSGVPLPSPKVNFKRLYLTGYLKLELAMAYCSKTQILEFTWHSAEEEIQVFRDVVVYLCAS